ncbi:hypothetical protein CRG98_021965, partial [Punica granatum]
MDDENEKRAHVLVVSFPIQGHINPLLQFSKLLASKGLKVTLIIPSSTTEYSPSATPSSISVVHIPKGYEDGDTLSIDERLQRFFTVVTRALGEFIRKQVESEFPPKVLVYDSTLAWALDIAHEHGLHAAPFFTQPCMVNAIHYLANHGQLKIPAQGPFRLIPSTPQLETSDLPSNITDTESHPVLMSLVLNQFSNLERARWILVNTFFELEEE